MNKICSVYSFAKLFLFFRRKEKKQKEFYYQKLALEVEGVLGSADNEITNKLLKRTAKYSIAIPALLGEAFCILRGKPMSNNERLALTCLGGLTGLFDDLFDENKLTDHQISCFIESWVFEVDLPDLHAIKFLYDKTLENSPNREFVEKKTKEVVVTQIESRKQQFEKLSKIDLKRISAQKGAAAMIMYRGAFDNDITNEQLEMLWQLGAIGQYVNDIFDVYNDTQAGIATFANQSTDVEKLQADFEEEIQKTVKLIRKSDFNLSDSKHFLEIIVLILAGGLVCMHNYKQLQLKTGGKFQLEKYSRKELICDMENPATVMKLLSEATKLEKDITRIND